MESGSWQGQRQAWQGVGRHGFTAQFPELGSASIPTAGVTHWVHLALVLWFGLWFFGFIFLSPSGRSVNGARAPVSGYGEMSWTWGSQQSSPT